MARLSFVSAPMLMLSATPAAARRLGGGDALNVSLARIVMALLLCIMIAVFAALILKRSGGRRDLARLGRIFVTLPAARRIDVIETRRVSQHADVCLFRCDGREYLVLCTPQQQLVLRETPVTEPAP